MKKFLRFTILFYFSLSITNELIHHFYFGRGGLTLLQVSLILTIFELFLKPIIRILLLPINLLTLGLFRIIIDTFGFYLALLFIDSFQIGTINIWSYHLTGFAAVIITAIITNFIFTIFRSLLTVKIKK